MVRLYIFSAAADMPSAAEYAAFIDAVIDSSPLAAASLYRVFPDDLARADALIATISDKDGAIAAAAHGVVDASGIGHINGLAKRAGASGALARLVVAQVIVELAKQGVTVWRADCRVFPVCWAKSVCGRDRSRNDASRAIFVEFGFCDDGEDMLPITGAPRDVHLVASSEPDAQTFRTAYVRSTTRTLALAHACLAALTQPESAR